MKDFLNILFVLFTETKKLKAKQKILFGKNCNAELVIYIHVNKSKIIDTLSNVKVLYKKVLNSLARMMYVNLLQSFCYYIFATQKHPEKTTDLQQVTDKLYHIMLYGVHLITSGNQAHNFSGDGHQLHR